MALPAPHRALSSVGAQPLMGGFFLLCKGQHENQSCQVSDLRRAFAELGFSDEHVIEDESYFLSVYGKFQKIAIAVQEKPNGDFIFTCGSLILPDGVGATAAD